MPNGRLNESIMVLVKISLSLKMHFVVTNIQHQLYPKTSRKLLVGKCITNFMTSNVLKNYENDPNTLNWVEKPNCRGCLIYMYNSIKLLS